MEDKVIRIIQKIGFLLNRFFISNEYNQKKGSYFSAIFSFLDYCFCLAYSLYKRIFERSTFIFLKNEIKPDAMVVDVGAGFGVYSKLFLELVGDNGKVFSYEPDSSNYQRCLRMLRKDKNYSNLSIYPLGVSMHKGRSYFVLDKFNPANHRIDNEANGGIEIETVNLDAHLLEYTDKIRFCKIDVQGHEISVLRGATQLLKSDECSFMIEFDSSFGMQNLYLLWSFMISHSYSAFQIEKNGTLSSFVLNEDFQGYKDIIFKKQTNCADLKDGDK